MRTLAIGVVFLALFHIALSPPLMMSDRKEMRSIEILFLLKSVQFQMQEASKINLDLESDLTVLHRAYVSADMARALLKKVPSLMDQSTPITTIRAVNRRSKEMRLKLDRLIDRICENMAEVLRKEIRKQGNPVQLLVQVAEFLRYVPSEEPTYWERKWRTDLGRAYSVLSEKYVEWNSMKRMMRSA